jgi:coenzyme F420-0:L-glutamate ligase/coenzyme F420-1:gamma-L-glutamate ligase
MANAGVDASNIEHAGASVERVLLLPRDPDGTAAALATALTERTGVAVGVVINDSVGRAWRHGTVGIALGSAGFPALHDRRGERDLFGRVLQVTEVALADQIAAAASLMQGEADEGRPVVLVRGLSWPRDVPHSNASALLRPRERDLFR